MKKGKKGQVLLYGVFAGLIAAVLVSIFSNASGKNFDVIGTSSLILLETANNAEKTLFYIDQSAKYSLQQSVYDLAQNGGVAEVETSDFGASADYECGKFNDAYVWYELINSGQDYAKKACFDENSANKNLKYLFNKNLNQYLQNHPSSILVDNYDYELKGSLEITGKAQKPLIFRISKGTEERQDDFSAVYPAESAAVKMAEPSATKPGIPVSYKYRLDGPKRVPYSMVDTIVLHHSGDDKASKTYNTLKNRKLSIHYIIDRDGTVYYVLDEDKKAFHAENLNSRSIGIEIVNTGRKDMEYTPEQYASIKSLIDDIAKRWNLIKVDNQHVVAHYQSSTTGKWDPSPNFDWSRIGLVHHTTFADLGRKAPSEYGYA